MVLSERVIEKLSDKSSKNGLTGAWRIWAYAALELEKADTVFQATLDKLKKAVELISRDGINDLNDAIVILTYTERDNNGDFLNTLDLFLNEVDLNKPEYQKNQADFFLLKARVTFRQQNNNIVKKFLEKAINSAPIAFAAPFWDDLVDFLKKLRASQCTLWKDMSLLAHHECQKREARIQKNIYLRWYWSRQKDLYDLAFLAADSSEKKADIADSLKSRPVLRYQALNELRGIKGIDKTINDLLEQEDEARDERYIKKTQNLNHLEKKLSEETEKKEVIPLNMLPSPWIAIHFYLNELETREGKKGGHAIIFDSQKNEWKECLFDYQTLHQNFLSWQEAYLSLDNTGISMADSLVELCYTIGDTLPFLFDENVIPKESKVLWIPHGFLHRLPLHAAICDSREKVFLEDHISRYLPAWNMLEKEKIKKSSSGEEYLLKDISGRTFNFLERRTWNNVDYKTKPATPELLIDCMKKKPSLLTILCHGEGNILNPFKSRLKLGSGISIIDILKSEVVNISGTGSC